MNDIINSGCQYIGDNEATNRCGAECVQGKSYCPDHVWMIYQQGTQQYKRKSVVKNSHVEFWENLFNEAAAEVEAEEGT